MPKRNNKQLPKEDEQTPSKKRKEDSLNILINLGYSEAESREFINNRKIPDNSVNKLIEVHTDLIRLGFTHKQLIRLSSRKGGRKNLDAVKTHYSALDSFTHEQITKIAAHNGGSNNVAAVVTHQALLRTFSPEQITKIAGHDGGSNNVAAVVANEEFLGAFNAEQVTKIVAHDGGSNNIKALKTYQQQLKNLDFNILQIVRMVSHPGGSKNLAAVVTHQKALQELDISREDIVRIVSQDGGSLNLQALLDHQKALRKKQFSLQQIITIAAHRSGSHILAALPKERKLFTLDLSAADIVRIVSYQSGLNNLNGVKKHWTRLSVQYHFTASEIVNMAAQSGGSKNLEAVAINYKKLRELGLTNQQILRLASHLGGSQILNAIIEKQAALKDLIKSLGLEIGIDQIVRIAAHSGGSKNLTAMEKYVTRLSANFSLEQIIHMVARQSGWKNLEAIIKHGEALKQIHPQFITQLICTNRIQRESLSEKIEECRNQQLQLARPVDPFDQCLSFIHDLPPTDDSVQSSEPDFDADAFVESFLNLEYINKMMVQRAATTAIGIFAPPPTNEPAPQQQTPSFSSRSPCM